MRNLCTILVFFISLAFCINRPICQADTFMVPLDVSGTYRTNVDIQLFSFDLGTALSEVHSVTIASDGLITAGVDHDGVPFSWDLEAYLYTDSSGPFDSSLVALMARGGESTYPDPEPFSTRNPFLTDNWDFLLDGKASGSVFPFLMGIVVGYEPQAMPEFTINNASLIIDAEPVPEPATLLFLGLGAILLRKKK